MSIVIRKTGNREYVYEAHRDGARMVQSYIGPLARLEVRCRVEAAQRVATIPEHTMRLFAGVDQHPLLLQKNTATIIMTVLERGDLEDVQWLTLAYAGSAIVDAVLAGTGLSLMACNFWRVWFEVSNAS
ncbi:MAG: hypothetical protein ACYDH4_08745 [Candidatus Cryosericum sp.]